MAALATLVRYPCQASRVATTAFWAAATCRDSAAWLNETEKPSALPAGLPPTPICCSAVSTRRMTVSRAQQSTTRT